MITNLIILAFYSLAWAVYMILSLIPVVSFPAELSTAMQNISAYIGAVDNFIPVSTVLIILGLFLTIESAVLIFKVIQWIIKKIPGIN